MKIQMACSTLIIQKEYEIFMKRQGNNLKDYVLSLNEKNQDIVSEAYSMASLFNIELEEKKE